MRDYNQGKIYKIINSENSKIYIGSTAMKYLCERMGSHRGSARRGPSRFYKAMREIGIAKFKIELIKEFPCASRSELEKEEYRIIQKVKKRGVSLYNTFIEKRGCVHLNVVNNYWSFEYYPVPGKKKNKSFSVKKYGDVEAKEMAIAYQNEIYPKI